MRTLDYIATGRLNNFTLVRACAAAAVMVSHAYPLATGLPGSEPLLKLGLTLGQQALIAFFAMSGFLVAQSFGRTPDLLRFATARALRIMPAYLALLAVTVSLVGPWATDLPVDRYLQDPDTFRYAWANGAFLDFVPRLPGVFARNPFTDTVNGSLWSLRYEVCCYALLYAAGRHGWLEPRRCWAFYLGGMAVSIACRHAGVGGIFSHVLPGFLTGIALYVYRARIPATATVFAGLVFTTWLLRDRFIHPELLRVTIAYGALWIATGSWPIGRILEGSGDYSYGLYLYGWPVEQGILHALPTTGVATLIALALPVTAVLAIASWHLIEKPALRFKTNGFRRRRAARALPAGAPDDTLHAAGVMAAADGRFNNRAGCGKAPICSTSAP